MVFGVKMIIGLLLSFLLLLASPLSADQRAEPLLVKSVDTREYSRVLGGPAGAFYFLSKNAVDIGTLSSGEFNIRSLKRKSKVQTSPDGAYFAMIDYSSLRPTTLEITEIRLYDSQGNPLWSKKNPGCGSFILCDAQPQAVGIGGAEGMPEATLYFYNSDGVIVKSVKVEHFTRGRYCEDGSCFFAVTGGGGILKFSNDGQQINKYPSGSDYRVSSDGDLLAALTDTAAFIYRVDELLLALPLQPFSFRDLKFAGDGSALALLLRDELRVYNLFDSTLVWRHSPADQVYRYGAFATDSGFSSFICGLSNSNDKPEERNSKGLVELLDASGGVVWTRELTFESWSTVYPAVRLTGSAKVISLLTPELLEIYKY